MSQAILPKIIDQTVEGEQAFYSLYISPDLLCFEGHFPGVAIVPGIVQIEWVVVLAGKLITLGEFKNMVRVKFNRPILPSITLKLHLALGNGKVQYRFFNDDGGFSSGRLIFV
ncbi:MAG: hypothetical protein GXP14_07015 [Gammaproteobacteria bacterium]|nr:hypothetical protein [Gammaproteobacteria bacterium]